MWPTVGGHSHRMTQDLIVSSSSHLAQPAIENAPLPPHPCWHRASYGHTMSAVADFLIDRITEDEIEAQLESGRWTPIDAWPPARVMAERRIKRNLVDWAEQGGNQFVLCQLASMYDDRPVWCEDWGQGPTLDLGADA